MKFNAEVFCSSDIATRAQWINDPRVHSSLHVRYPTTIKDTTDWFNATSKDPSRIDVVFKDTNGVSLGMAGLSSINKTDSNAEFYVFVNPDLQGQGIGPAITIWMLNYGFYHYKLNKIYLYTDSINEPAIKLYKKLGFILEGRQRRHRFKDGTLRDKLAFGMLQEEWKAQDWSEYYKPGTTETDLKKKLNYQ